MIPQSMQSNLPVTGNGDVIVLNGGGRRICVQVPKSYEELLNIAKELLNFDHDQLVFKTDDLNVCRGSLVEIHKSSWDAVRSIISNLNVSSSIKSRSGILQHTASAKRTQGVSISGTRVHIASTSEVKPASSHRPGLPQPLSAGRSLQDPTDDNYVLPTSIDSDNVSPVDSDKDFFEDTNDENIPPQVSPMKGKGKARARKQVLSSDEEDDVVEHSSIFRQSANKPTPFSSSRVASYSSPAAAASPANKVSGTPRDVPDMFSPNVKKAQDKAAPRRMAALATDEEENDENAAPLSVRLAGSRSSATAISKSINPEVRSVKKTPQKSHSYVPDGEVSPSPKPKVNGATPGFKNAPVQGSSLRQSMTDFEETEKPVVKVEPLAPLRATTPLPDEKIIIIISHEESGNEGKFKVRGKHSVERVMKTACSTFGLDLDRARLFLVEQDDGIEMRSECRRDLSMVHAGIKNESQLRIVLDDEIEEEEEEDYSD